MTRTTSPRWGTQLVMWSSPLLLLVMLFSMTASARTTTPTTHVDSPQISPHGATSIPTTTTTVRRTSTTVALPPTLKAPPSTTPATTYASATASNASSAAFIPNASIVSGATSGDVSAYETLDVPLQGPGAWVLSASTPVASHLRCPQVNTTFTHQIVIDSAQTCQLLITSTGSSTTWRLIPVP
jgi:hypothetical protein